MHILELIIIIIVILFIGGLFYFTYWELNLASCEELKGVSIKNLPARCLDYYQK